MESGRVHTLRHRLTVIPYCGEMRKRYNKHSKISRASHEKREEVAEGNEEETCMAPNKEINTQNIDITHMSHGDKHRGKRKVCPWGSEFCGVGTNEGLAENIGNPGFEVMARLGTPGSNLEEIQGDDEGPTGIPHTPPNKGVDLLETPNRKYESEDSRRSPPFAGKTSGRKPLCPRGWKYWVDEPMEGIEQII